jgi:hypothetical protein
MEETEYNAKLKKAGDDYEAAKKAIYIEFAMSHVKYSKGDIIKQTFGSETTILIDKIYPHKSIGLPEPVYDGVVLKKDLTPKKNFERHQIYGDRLTELVRAKEVKAEDIWNDENMNKIKEHIKNNPEKL